MNKQFEKEFEPPEIIQLKFKILEMSLMDDKLKI
jgi:hypothetical protein